MKKLLSVILSVAILATSTVFAAPMAVAPETAEEQVVEVTPADETDTDSEEEAVKQDEEQAELAASYDLTHGKPEINALTYGVALVDRHVPTVKTSDHWTSVELDGGGVSISFTANWQGHELWNGNGTEITLVSGNTYALVYEFAPGQSVSGLYPTLNADGLNQLSQITLPADDNAVHFQKNYRYFFIKDGQSLSRSFINIGATSGATADTPVVANVKSVGLYYKPTTLEAVPTPIYNAQNSTVTISYPNGLHEEVKAALQLDGAISSVNNVEIDETGKVVTYYVRDNTTISIPSLVNAEATATYPAQSLFLNVPTKRTLDFGLTFFSNDMSNVTLVSDADHTILRNEDGTVSFIKTRGDFYGRIDITPVWTNGTVGGVKIEPGRVYTMYVDFAPSQDITVAYPAIHGNAVSQHMTTYTNLAAVDSDSTVMQFSADKPYKKFKRNAETAYVVGACGVGTNGKEKTIVVDKISMYYKPEAQLEAPLPVFDFAENTVTITYEDGLHPEVLEALTLENAIDGVANISINGNTVTYTVTPDTVATVPALINADATAVYPEQQIGFERADVNTVKYGARLVYRNFIDTPFVGTDSSTGAVTVDGVASTQKVYEAKANEEGKGVDVTMIKCDSSWKYPNLFPVSFTLSSSNTYYHVTKMTSSTGLDCKTLMPTVNRLPLDMSFENASYGATTTSVGISARDYKSTTDAVKDGDYYVKTFTVNADAKASRMSIGSTQNTAGTVTVESLGMYYMPKATVENDVTYTVDMVAGTIVATYPDGVYPHTVKSLLANPTSIDGVTAVSYDGARTITFTVVRDKDVTIPAFVNRDETATYPSFTACCNKIDKSAVYYGERWAYRNFIAQPLTESIIRQGSGYKIYEVVNNPDNGIDFTTHDSTKTNGGNGEWKYPALITGTFVFEPGYTYTQVADMDKGTSTPTKLMPMINGTAWWAAEAGLTFGQKNSNNYFADNDFIREFDVTAIKTTYSLGVGATDSAVGTSTIRSYGVYRKPATTIEATYVTDRKTNTIKVTYAEGIYDLALGSLLADPTMIPGVTSITQNGNELTFVVERNKEIAIPELVNASKTAKYNAVNVIFEEAYPEILTYGFRYYYNDFDEATSAPTGAGVATNTLVDDGNGGKAVRSKLANAGTETVYPGYDIMTQPTYNFDAYKYTYAVDVIENGGTRTTDGETENTVAGVRFGGNAWFMGVSSSSTSQTTLNGVGHHVYSPSSSSDTKYAKVGMLFNAPKSSDTYVTIDNFGCYMMPKVNVTENATVPIYSKGGKVTITYPEGLHEAVKNYLTEASTTVIEGVNNIEVDGNTVTYTIEENVTVTVPGYINEAGTAKYLEQELRFDVYSAKYGIKEFLQDYSETVSYTRQSLTVTQEDGRMRIELPADSTATWGNANIADAGKIAIKPNRVYTMFADIEVEDPNFLNSMRFGLDGSAEIPVKFYADSTGWQTPYAGSMTLTNTTPKSTFSSEYGTITEFTFDPDKLQNFKYTNAGKEFTIDNTINKQNGEYPNSAWYVVLSAKGSAYVDNFGLYYRPAAKEVAVKTTVSGNTLSITYENGVYRDSIAAICVYPDVVGATEASYDSETNTLTLIAENVNDILVPELVNANADKTYAAVKGFAVPANVEKGIRTNIKDYGMGVRAVAKVNQQTRAIYGDENVEYGTLVTLDNMLSSNNLTAYDLTFDTQAKQGTYDSRLVVISEASYKGDGKTNKLTIDGEYESYAAAFVGIPQTAENYKKNLVFRHYVKYTVNDVTYIVYGEPLAISPYSVATEILESSEDKTTEIAVYCQGIIDFCDGNSETLSTQA